MERVSGFLVSSTGIVLLGAGPNSGAVVTTGPTLPRSEAKTAAALLFALWIRQFFDPGAGLWCIGQMAWSPCAHVHSSGCSADVSQTISGEPATAAI